MKSLIFALNGGIFDFNGGCAMDGIVYLSANPDFLDRWEKVDWEKLSSDERRAAADFSWLWGEAALAFLEHLRASMPNAVDGFEHTDFWEDGEIPRMTLKTKSGIPHNKNTFKIDVSLRLATDGAEAKLVLFGDFGTRPQANRDVKLAFANQYGNVLGASPARAPKHPRIRVIRSPGWGSGGTKYRRLVVDLDGWNATSSPQDFVEICRDAFGLMIEESARIGLVL